MRKDTNVNPRNVIEENKNVTAITNPRKPSVIPSQEKNKGKMCINDPAKLDLIASNNPYL